jgi:hypothetical protein
MTPSYGSVHGALSPQGTPAAAPDGDALGR